MSQSDRKIVSELGFLELQVASQSSPIRKHLETIQRLQVDQQDMEATLAAQRLSIERLHSSRQRLLWWLVVAVVFNLLTLTAAMAKWGA